MTETVEFTIADHEGKVVLQFGKPMSVVPLEPEQARQIAEAMGKSAYKAAYGIEAGQRILSEQLRERLTTRTTHIIRSMLQQDRGPAQIAVQVVDTILAEV